MFKKLRRKSINTSDTEQPVKLENPQLPQRPISCEPIYQNMYKAQVNQTLQPQVATLKPLIEKSLFEQSIPYHSAFSRKDAEDVLKSQPIGTYLLRQCRENKRDVILCYRDSTEVGHIKISDCGQDMYKINAPDMRNHQFSSVQSATFFFLETVMIKFGLTPRPYDGKYEEVRRIQNPISRKPSELKHRPSMTSIQSAPLDDIKGYFGKLSRVKVQEMLENENPGTYIIRESETKYGSYSLSYKSHTNINHALITDTGQKNEYLANKVKDLLQSKIQDSLGIEPVPFDPAPIDHIYEYEDEVNSLPSKHTEDGINVCGSISSTNESTTSNSDKRINVPELSELPWFHQAITSSDAKQLVTNKPVGSYLLRDCISSKGNYTLTYRDVIDVKNIIILSLDNKSYKIMNQQPSIIFQSIGKAVEFILMNKSDVSKRFVPQPVCSLEESMYADFNTEIMKYQEKVEKSSQGLNTELYLQPFEVKEKKILNPALIKHPELSELLWYHGDKTSITAVKELLRQSVGSYVLRNCESSRGNFSLSYRDVDKIKHLIILTLDNGKYKIMNESPPVTFKTIKQTVRHFINRKKDITAEFIPNPIYQESVSHYADINQEMSFEKDNGYVRMKDIFANIHATDLGETTVKEHYGDQSIFV